MKLGCIFGHKWDGCICKKCGNVTFHPTRPPRGNVTFHPKPPL